MFPFYCTCGMRRKYHGDPHLSGCPQYVAPKKASPDVEYGACTCGVKFTGGLCSDWCDSKKPKPQTYEYETYDQTYYVNRTDLVKG